MLIRLQRYLLPYFTVLWYKISLLTLLSTWITYSDREINPCCPYCLRRSFLLLLLLQSRILELAFTSVNQKKAWRLGHWQHKLMHINVGFVPFILNYSVIIKATAFSSKKRYQLNIIVSKNMFLLSLIYEIRSFVYTLKPFIKVIAECKSENGSGSSCYKIQNNARS
jgi:hypothetical protein